MFKDYSEAQLRKVAAREQRFKYLTNDLQSKVFVIILHLLKLDKCKVVARCAE